MTRSAAVVLLFVVLIVILLPAAIVTPGRQGYRSPEIDNADQTDEHEKSPAGKSLTVTLFVADRDEYLTMELEEYLVGVVMAEMPALFGLEALKAQAVIARTYTLHKIRSLGGSGCGAAEAADICSDSTHCQAWVDPEVTAVKWWPEEEIEKHLAKIRQAVQETEGEVVVYQGRLIDAVYHSACGGQTEASHAVWTGGRLPYLQSLPCEYCSHSPYNNREILITFEQFIDAFGQELPLPVATAEELPLEVAGYTPGGRVETLRVNETVFEGKEVRRLLGLPSTAFEWELKADGLLFTSRGHGHGVGLCQYGADGMAATGKTYHLIISYYYPGTDIAVFSY